MFYIFPSKENDCFSVLKEVVVYYEAGQFNIFLFYYYLYLILQSCRGEQGQIVPCKFPLTFLSGFLTFLLLYDLICKN